MTRRLAAAVLTLVVLAACGGGEAPPAQRPTLAAWGDLPPNDVGSVNEIYAEEMAALGVRLVRAALVDTTSGGFVYDPEGTHLALYVEPVGEVTTQDYMDRILPVTEVFASTLFARWTGLESFDVCQEPPPGVDDSETPPPVSQVTLWREEAGGIDWETFDLVDLLTLAREAHPEDGRPRALVTAAAQLAGFPPYREAVEEAERIAGSVSA